jgi:hypothetical protein
VHGSYWQQLVPVAQELKAGAEQPECEPLGHVPASPIEKHTGAAPPQHGMMQYCSSSQVVVPQIVEPPPVLTALPPVALFPPVLLDPPMLELPPVLVFPSLGVPPHPEATRTTRAERTVQSEIAMIRLRANAMPSNVQRISATFVNECANLCQTMGMLRTGAHQC